MKVLITGGLGFIGVNTAIEFYKEGYEIFLLDNLSRKGNIENLIHLRENMDFTFCGVDIRNCADLEKVFKENTFDVIIHLAAQVAVTTSVKNPREDFEINAFGTFNLIECVRNYSPKSLLIYSSTNKVYGEFKSEIVEEEFRYAYKEENSGINEDQNLDFHSPYGCSKGTADQYVRDYSRIYNLKTVVLRQSCIYGPNQFGIEDQGWVSWFSISSIFNKEFTIYGNGKQVRDVLHVFDLISLYKKIIDNVDVCVGKIYNIGGGSFNKMSLLELIQLISKKLDKDIVYNYSDWRPGDQKIYVSDIKKINKDIGWEPKITPDNGVSMMIDWILGNKEILKKLKIA